MMFVNQLFCCLNLAFAAATLCFDRSVNLHSLKVSGLSVHVCASLIQEVEKGKKKGKSKPVKVRAGKSYFCMSFVHQLLMSLSKSDTRMQIGGTLDTFVFHMSSHVPLSPA